jgi:hypothetical protein
MQIKSKVLLAKKGGSYAFWVREFLGELSQLRAFRLVECSDQFQESFEAQICEVQPLCLIPPLGGLPK